MPAGRPLKFTTVEDLEKKVAKYFKWCDSRTVTVVTKQGKKVKLPNPRPYTISGLANFLDTSRETLLNYQERPEFFDTIRAAKDKCEAFVEESLWEPKIASGVIFNLTNNYGGWKDKKETEFSGSLSLTKLFEKAKDEPDAK